MSRVNKVILIGNLGKDPELRYTLNGNAVTNFSIATSSAWKDKETGEKRQRTEWHRIIAWRGLAEICAEYLAKGQQVYVEGRLQTRSWEKDGITRYITEIIASDVQFLGKRKDAPTTAPVPETPAPAAPIALVRSHSMDDDDIPF